MSDKQMQRRDKNIRRIKLAAFILTFGCGIAWLVAISQGYALEFSFTPKDQLSALSLAMEQFAADHGRYPTQEEGLQALVKEPEQHDDSSIGSVPYIDSYYTSDFWGHAYTYVYPGQHGSAFDISSPGRDGLYGTPDDIKSWNLDALEKHYPSGCKRVWTAHPLPTIFGWGFFVALLTWLTMWVIDPLLSIRRA